MNNLKAIMEKRDELQQKMDSLVSKADQETRAMTDEEVAEFDAAEKEIRAIDETIARDENCGGGKSCRRRKRVCGLRDGEDYRNTCR